MSGAADGTGGVTVSATAILASQALLAGAGGVLVAAVSTPSSASGGPLPQRNAPISQQQIEDTLQLLVAGLLRLSTAFVRPRWQVNDPNQPTAGTDWVSLGITSRDTVGFPYISHVRGGPSTLKRWPLLTVLISCYGPNSPDNAEMLRDAFYIGQNLETLYPLGLRFVEAGQVIAVPDLLNVQWINRADIRVMLSMEQSREYNILDIASSAGTITTDTGVSGSWLALNPP